MTWVRKYVTTFQMGFQTALEYRINFAISLISAIYPIIVQSFLWTAIFLNASGSTVYGFTYRQIIAYTFLAGLISRIVRTGFEYEVMDDVKNGRYSKFLVQPVGYFPYRLASFIGGKLPGLVMILGVLVAVLLGLNAIWGVTLELGRLLFFPVALILAMALNFLIFYCISAVAFWLVEIGFLFEGVRIVFILLSGGIFPLEVFGQRFVQVMTVLPFKYTINYPITVLNGKMPYAEMPGAMLVQLAWIAACLLLARALWRVGSRKYIAVGG